CPWTQLSNRARFVDGSRAEVNSSTAELRNGRHRTYGRNSTFRLARLPIANFSGPRQIVFGGDTRPNFDDLEPGLAKVSDLIHRRLRHMKRSTLSHCSLYTLDHHIGGSLQNDPMHGLVRPLHQD